MCNRAIAQSIIMTAITIGARPRRISIAMMADAAAGKIGILAAENLGMLNMRHATNSRHRYSGSKALVDMAATNNAVSVEGMVTAAIENTAAGADDMTDTASKSAAAQI